MSRLTWPSRSRRPPPRRGPPPSNGIRSGPRSFPTRSSGNAPGRGPVYRVHSPVGDRDPTRIHAVRERASTFVLIPNLSAADHDARRILEEYKGQTVIAQRFHFLKDPAFVDPCSCNGPSGWRPSVRSCCWCIWCRVLLERRVRQGPPLPPSRGLLKRPIGQEILHHLRPLIETPLDITRHVRKRCHNWQEASELFKSKPVSGRGLLAHYTR